MKSNHRILIPAVYYPPVLGGFEVFLQNIAERVGKHTYIRVLAGKVIGTDSVERRGMLTVSRKYSLYSLRDLSGSSYVYILTTLPILFFGTVCTLKSERISLMHANGFFNGLVCMLASAATGVPYVMTIQSADFTIYHPEVKLNVLVKLQSHVERLIYKRASLCHAVSNDLCEHFRNQGVHKCIMIPNGVEQEHFYPADQRTREEVRDRYNIPKEASVVVTISRLEHKNGVHDLIEAISAIDDVYLVIAGDGSERSKLEQQANDLGISSRVIFLGGIPKHEVGLITASCDVFARTPLSEGFGISFLEGMAAGVPVVATPVGGIPDFLENGETGLFAETGNPTSIKEALKKALSDNVLRDHLVKNGRRLIEEKYNWDVIAKRIEDEVYSV